ncbi:hypothetical protein TNCV_95961 [Trichonephila clavipes]|nr:hypothetical protein TNCV_95961 [Trichonephila clavipes]
MPRSSSDHATQLLWSRLIQFKCVPADLFHDYLEQEARKGKGAFYPSDVDCHWQAQIMQFGDQGLHRADSNPLIHLAQIPCLGWFNEFR